MYTLSKRKHTLKLMGERLHYGINSGNYKQKMAYRINTDELFYLKIKKRTYK